LPLVRMRLFFVVFLLVSPLMAQKSAPLPADAAAMPHGLYIVAPPADDSKFSCHKFPEQCYSKHLIPALICLGPNNPPGRDGNGVPYNCTQAGAGSTIVKGAIFRVNWNAVNTANGTYDFSLPDREAVPWIAAGKPVGFVFNPVYERNTKSLTPTWYSTPANISSVSRSGGVLTVQTSSDMDFFPGGVATAKGLEIQIIGTRTALDGDGTAASNGIYTVCDHTAAGCSDPRPRTITAISSGPNVAAVRGGTVGNPMYGSQDGSTCTSGVIPIEWRPNFIRAWQNFMKAVVNYYGSNPHISYVRFGLGVLGQSNPTSGLSDHDPNQQACQAQMVTYGFTSVAAPWPAPTDSAWSQVQAVWEGYINTMLQYMHSLHSPKTLQVTISPIQPSPIDLSTPNLTAANAVAAGIGIGNQGLQRNDPMNYGQGRECKGGNWCANFAKYRGQVNLELQTTGVSDPNQTNDDLRGNQGRRFRGRGPGRQPGMGTNENRTGSLANILPFATERGVNILELYYEDWMCAFDPGWDVEPLYQDCQRAGYPEVLRKIAGQLN